MSQFIRPVSRRTALKTGASAAVLGALGAPMIAHHALGQSAFNWKRFSGTKIDVLLVKNPRSDLMQAADVAEKFDAHKGKVNR